MSHKEILSKDEDEETKNWLCVTIWTFAAATTQYFAASYSLNKGFSYSIHSNSGSQKKLAEKLVGPPLPFLIKLKP